jgi:hypothetical protein
MPFSPPAAAYRWQNHQRLFVTKAMIIGWIIYLSGSAFWLYGYFVVGHQSIVDWHARAPWWIADFLPNLESELGMLFCIGGMVPMCWPRSKK